MPYRGNKLSGCFSSFGHVCACLLLLSHIFTDVDDTLVHYVVLFTADQHIIALQSAIIAMVGMLVCLSRTGSLLHQNDASLDHEIFADGWMTCSLQDSKGFAKYE